MTYVWACMGPICHWSPANSQLSFRGTDKPVSLSTCDTIPAYVSQAIQSEIRSLPHIFSFRRDGAGLRSDLGPAYGSGLWQYVTGNLNRARRFHGGVRSGDLGVWPGL